MQYYLAFSIHTKLNPTSFTMLNVNGRVNKKKTLIDT